VSEPSQYFASRPAVGSDPHPVDLVLPDLRLRLTTDRGVFSAGGVDPGTKFLLLDAPMPSQPQLLADVGCGYGPIAVTLARRFPDATVWAVDVNERARALCRANADAAGCANVVVLAPEEVPAGVAVDAAYSNPPLRMGKAPLHDLLEGWLARLRPGGWLVQVVHRHLGADSLQRWLVDSGWPTERLGSRAGYRVLRTVAPAGPSEPGASASPTHRRRPSHRDAGR
jgi:16S rRNA (guanine1207-N2)-methyltransferase